MSGRMEEEMYTEASLARVAKRENNNKRKYLVVNPLQGKHVPVGGAAALSMFDALAARVRAAYPGQSGERLLLVGFAETATAIGARLAVTLGTLYMQTTREVLENAGYLFFTESHSHATEQKLCKDDVDGVIGRIDRIIFVEDEVTTGNTIMKIINIIESRYEAPVKFAVASLLNGMEPASLERYAQRGVDVHYLVKTHHEGYTAVAEGYREGSGYIGRMTADSDAAVTDVSEGYINTRRLCGGREYGEACDALAQRVAADIPEGAETVAVIGTEEFMYPAIHTAALLGERGIQAFTHSTTRSPIAVSEDEGYPLSKRYELASLYDGGRRTFIYDLRKYDCVIVLTDAPVISDEGLSSLTGALRSAGNENIQVYRWCGNGKRQ